MAKRRKTSSPHAHWPASPPGRDVVLHARVVTGTGGGPDKTILLSIAELGQTHYWGAAAYMHPPDDPGFASLEHRAQMHQCPVISIHDRGPLDGSVPRQLRDLCRHLNVRIWHGHDYKSNLLGLMLRPFWNMKLISTVHGWVKQTTRTPLYYAVDRLCLPYYHHVISVSEDLHQRVQELGVPDERCTLLPNGIDERVFQRRYPAGQSPLRQKFGVPPGRLVVGAVGRLSAEKAFNNLIHATGALLGEGRDIELWIAGEGDAHAELTALVQKLGLEQRVRLLGFFEETVELYHALDVFVLSSLREGLPNVVLEAMSMRVPLVSTSVAGVPRLITHGENGLLCAPGDVQALTEQMRMVVTDSELRQRMAAAARMTIEQKCTFAQRMAGEVAIYDRVLGVAAEGNKEVRTPPPGDNASADPRAEAQRRTA